MAAKKKGTDEAGNPIPDVKPKGYTTRNGVTGGFGKTRERASIKGGTIRSRKVEKQGSRSGSSARARGVETGGVAKPKAKVSSYPSSIRAATRKPSMSGGTVRSTGAEKRGSRSGSSARARGAETGGVTKPYKPVLGKKSSPSSIRATAQKKGSPSSFRSNRFGKGKKGGSAQVTPRSNQSMRAAEYKKKNPGKY